MATVKSNVKKSATPKNEETSNRPSPLRKSAPVSEQPENVIIFKTTYHFWRNWVREILREGKIDGAKFIKEEVGYNGQIQVPFNQKQKALDVFSKYKKDNPEVVDMWS